MGLYSRGASAALLMIACSAGGADENGSRKGALPSIKSRATQELILRPADLPSDEQLEREGATIGQVIIDPRQIFDTTDPADDRKLFRLANRLHLETRQKTIASQLLFRAGERYQGRLLEESERILRQSHYLRDAWIRPIAYNNGVVDIEVITRDVWTLNPGFSVGRKGGKNTSGFEIEDKNFLGRGEQLSLGRKSGVDRSSTIFGFSDKQLWGSWWGMDARYADNSDGRTEELSLGRPFYSLDTRWSAGIQLKNDRRVDSLYDLGEIVDRFQTRENVNSVYLGFSRGLRNGWVRRWTAGFSSERFRFSSMPDASLSLLLPGDRKLQYPWVGFELLQDDFRIARNRDQIEKTEDVPLGWRASMRLGYATPSFGADRNALIFASELSKGFELDTRQTLLLNSSLTGRLESGSLANTVASATARYYLRQSPRRLLFVGLSTDIGSNLDLDKRITLGGDTGLRGYPLRYQGGEGNWLFTAEQRFFTNWYPFRLTNVGAAIFFDAGRTWGKNPMGTPSQGVLKDIGLGLRLGNGRSALGNVIHLDLAFPLDGNTSIDRMQFLIETKRSF